MNGGKAIYSILKNNAAVNAIVGTGDNCRVFPLIENQSYTMPFITYDAAFNEPNPTKSGPSTLDEKSYQINIVAATPDACEDLAEKVRLALDYSSGTYDDIVLQHCYYTDERNGWFEKAVNDGATMIIQDYTLLIVR